MKNREKYREEILNSVFSGNVEEYCKLAKKDVLPKLTDCTNGECDEVSSCMLCRTIFAFWLDEEYEESPKPEVDWDNVPVDTLVRVRNDSNTPWKLKYFRSYNPQNYHKFETWGNGATSKTTDCVVRWLFCELVEDEVDSIKQAR